MRSPQYPRPGWLLATIAATSLFLPVLGISVMVWIVGEQLVTRLRKG
ncbi:MAG: hypothetical protein U0903_12025 [Planctomycetales bacterium]